MTTLTLSARGPRSPEEVWTRYAEPARWPEWSPQIRAVRASAARIAPGVDGEVAGWCGLGVRFVIDEVDESARCWTWRVHTGPIQLRLGHDVRADGPGTRTTLRIDGPALVVAGYLPLARVALHRLVH